MSRKTNLLTDFAADSPVYVGIAIVAVFLVIWITFMSPLILAGWLMSRAVAKFDKEEG